MYERDKKTRLRHVALELGGHGLPRSREEAMADAGGGRGIAWQHHGERDKVLVPSEIWGLLMILRASLRRGSFFG